MTTATTSEEPVSADTMSKAVAERPKIPVPRFIDYLDILPSPPMSNEQRRQMAVEWLKLRGISDAKTIEGILAPCTKSIEVRIVIRDGVLSIRETGLLLKKLTEFARETGISVFTAEQR